MIYDFELIKLLCDSYGVESKIINDHECSIIFKKMIEMRIINSQKEDNSLIYFVGSKWHFHDDFLYLDCNGNEVGINYLIFLEEIILGNILICKKYINGEIDEISCIHKKQIFSDLEYLKNDEEILIMNIS